MQISLQGYWRRSFFFLPKKLSLGLHQSSARLGLHNHRGGGIILNLVPVRCYRSIIGDNIHVPRRKPKQKDPDNDQSESENEKAYLQNLDESHDIHVHRMIDFSSLPVTQKDINSYFQDNSDDYLDFRQITWYLKASGEKGSKLQLDKFLPRILALFSKVEFKSSEIAATIYGFGNWKFLSPIRIEMIKLVSVILARYPPGSFRSRDVAIALFGLRNLTNNNMCVLELLDSLYIPVSTCIYEFSSQAIGMSLYGMKSMKLEEESEEKIYSLRKILEALDNHISTCNDPFNNQSIAMSLYGLQNFKCKYTEVKNIVYRLASKFASCENPLDDHAIGCSLYSLQNMGSGSYHVRFLLSVLKKLIERTKDQITPTTISRSIFGLQKMFSNVEEVSALISLISYLLLVLEVHLIL